MACHQTPPQVDRINVLLRRVDLSTGLVTTIAGSLAGKVGTGRNAGLFDGIGTSAAFYGPRGLAMDAAGSFVVIVRPREGGCEPPLRRFAIPSLLSPPQADSFNNALRRVNLSSGFVTTVGGNLNLSSGPPVNYGHSDGVGTAASFYYPSDIAMDSIGSFAIIVRALSGNSSCDPEINCPRFPPHFPLERCI